MNELFIAGKENIFTLKIIHTSPRSEIIARHNVIYPNRRSTSFVGSGTTFLFSIYRLQPVVLKWFMEKKSELFDSSPEA